MLHRLPSPAPATLRKRAERRRRKAGEAAYRVVVPEWDVVAALLASGRLTPEEGLRRSLVERELAAVLAEWAARWKTVTL